MNAQDMNAQDMSGITREAIVTVARGWLGTPYMHQASLKGVGCDCLGLLRGVWRDIYGSEPEAPPTYTADWAEAGAGERLAAAATRHLVPIEPAIAAAGDVVLFRWRRDLPAKHVGIMTSSGVMIHAHDGVAVTEVHLGLWQRRIAFAFRFPGAV